MISERIIRIYTDDKKHTIGIIDEGSTELTMCKETTIVNDNNMLQPALEIKNASMDVLVPMDRMPAGGAGSYLSDKLS